MKNRKEEQYWEKIDDFLDGNLNIEQRTAFEQQLSQSDEIRKDLTFQQQLRKGIAYGSQGSLRGRLAVIHEETIGNAGGAKVVAIGSKLWMRWSAAAALVIAALGILFWIQDKPTETELFAQNYSPYQHEAANRGPSQDNSLTLAINAYQNGNYSAAIPAFERALRIKPDPSAQLALAVSYWETKQPAAAETTLQPLFEHYLLQDQAYWYAALFALAQQDREKAISYLKLIPEDSRNLHKKGQKLLKQLR